VPARCPSPVAGDCISSLTQLKTWCSEETEKEAQKMSGERTVVVASELAEALGPHLDPPPPPISLSLSPYRHFLLRYSCDIIEAGPMIVPLKKGVMLL
jgi:hypothetical protein